MSRIEIVNAVYQRKINENTNKTSRKPVFMGSSQELTDLVRGYGKTTIERGIGAKGWLSRLTQYLKINDGEIQNQKINALFTCTLAPLMIAFNPLSNKDEKTKKYTALRQPISAVNAIIFGFSMTVPFDRLMEKTASEGYFKTIDLRCSPDTNYLLRIYNKKIKNIKDTPEKLKEFLNTFSTEVERNQIEMELKEDFPKSYKKKLLKEYGKTLFVKVEKDKARQLYTRLLCEDPKTLKNDSEIISKVSNLDEYLKRNNFYEVDFSKYMKEYFDTKFFIEKSGINSESAKLELKEKAFEKQVKQIKAIDFLRKMGFVKMQINKDDGKYTTDSFHEENLSKFLSQKRAEKLVKYYVETHGISEEQARKLIEEQGKLHSRDIQFRVSSEILNEETNTLEQLLENIDYSLKEFMEDINNKKTSEVMKKFAKKLKGMDIIAGNDLPDFASQIMKNRSLIFEMKFGGMKKYGGIFFNLFSSAAACAALNWMYPRIVALLFPRLIQEDKKEGGNK